MRSLFGEATLEEPSMTKPVVPFFARETATLVVKTDIRAGAMERRAKGLKENDAK
jgi:hypothetical protein